VQVDSCGLPVVNQHSPWIVLGDLGDQIKIPAFTDKPLTFGSGYMRGFVFVLERVLTNIFTKLKLQNIQKGISGKIPPTPLSI
jgi:hypothetical protein